MAEIVAESFVIRTYKAHEKYLDNQTFSYLSYMLTTVDSSIPLRLYQQRINRVAFPQLPCHYLDYFLHLPFSITQKRRVSKH